MSINKIIPPLWANIVQRTSHPNWDYEGAKAITNKIWVDLAMLAKLIQLIGPTLPEPRPSPGTDGSAFLTWAFSNGRRFTVERTTKGLEWTYRQEDGYFKEGEISNFLEMLYQAWKFYFDRRQCSRIIERHKMTNQNKQLRVILFPDGEYWIAQCLEFDICAQGKTQEIAIKNLDHTFMIYDVIGFSEVPEPPPRFGVLFDESERWDNDNQYRFTVRIAK